MHQELANCERVCDPLLQTILDSASPLGKQERKMLGKSNDDIDQVPPPLQRLRHSEEQEATGQASCISRGMTVVGKIFGESTVQLFGRIEGELRALTVLINEGAEVEGEVVAGELTICGQVKGTIHANRVKLNSTAMVEGDIFHRSLSIEENARFEGSSKRQNVRTMLSISRAPYCSAGLPTATSRMCRWADCFR